MYLPVFYSRRKDFIVEGHCKLLKPIKWASQNGLVDESILGNAINLLKVAGKLIPGSINERVRILSNDGSHVDFPKMLLVTKLEFFKNIFECNMSKCRKTQEGFYEVKSEFSSRQLESF